MTAEQSTFPISIGVRGRRDKDGTEATIKLQPLRVSLKHLMSLKVSADAAREQYNAGVKAVAEKTGLMSSVVSKLVKARSGDKFDDERRKAEQTALLFDEIGEDENPERQSSLDSMESGAAKPPKNGKGAKNGDGTQPPIGEGEPPADPQFAGTDLDPAKADLDKAARRGKTAATAH